MATAKKQDTPEPSKALVVPDEKPTSALATVDEALLDSIMDDAGHDKGISSKDMAIPFLKVVQALTPERQRGDAKYVPGLEEGDIFDTMSGKFWKGTEGAVVVPVRFTRSYTEWQPNRGGFVADHGADESILKKCAKNERGRPALPNGNEVQEAMLYFVLVVDPETGEFEQKVISLTSTQMKKARKWNSDMRTVLTTHPKTGRKFNPATYFYAYRITTVPESKDKYNWMGVKIEFFGGSPETAEVIKFPYGAGLYMTAREIEAQIVAGTIKAAPPAEDVTEFSEVAEPTPGEAVPEGAGDFEFPE